MAWRWIEPGRKPAKGMLEATRDAAIADAVSMARGGRPVDDAAHRALLWRSMEAAGWALEEVGP